MCFSMPKAKAKRAAKKPVAVRLSTSTAPARQSVRTRRPTARVAVAPAPPSPAADSDSESESEPGVNVQLLQAELLAFQRRLSRLEENNSVQELPSTTATVLQPPHHHSAVPLQSAFMASHQFVNPVQSSENRALLAAFPGTAGETLSRAFVLGLTVPPSVKAKIWAGEYVELATLNSASVIPDSRELLSAEEKKACPKYPKIENIWDWLRMFHIFASIYTSKHLELAPELFSYETRIIDLHRRYKGFVWKAYDERFRAARAVVPSLSWEKINWDLVMELIGDHAATSERNDKPHKHPENVCRKFLSKGVCDFGASCKFRHLCGVCMKGDHSRLQCQSGLGA